MKKIENNENSSICAKCGGKCCKHYGGIFHPEDFEALTEELIKVIDKGDISIDWLEPEEDKGFYENVYFLRMRHVDAAIIDPAFMGKCIHLTPTGCNLSFDQRAYGCKSLQVDDEMNCAEGCYDKYTAARDWLPHQGIMKKLMDYYRDQQLDFFKKKEIINVLKHMGLNIDVFKDAGIL